MGDRGKGGWGDRVRERGVEGQRFRKADGGQGVCGQGESGFGERGSGTGAQRAGKAEQLFGWGRPNSHQVTSVPSAVTTVLCGGVTV